MRKLILTFLAFALTLPAQRLDPIQWTLTSEEPRVLPGETIPLRLTAKMQEGWHLYSLTTPAGGPIRTKASLASNSAIEKWVMYQPTPEKKFDANFNLDTETFGHEAVFLVSAQLKRD